MIRETQKMVLKDVRAEVYEGGYGDELFIRIFETKHEGEVCLDASEAAALREWLGSALQRKADAT